LKIAVAGGKGGSGKTTVAVNLALSLEKPVQILDCDVEEPNVHLFLPLKDFWEEPVKVPVPIFNQEKCTLCGKCSSFCQYHAIAQLPSRLIFFQELCHGCGGCRLVCPVEAISEAERTIGVVRGGKVKDGLSLVYGLLNVGEPRASPLVEAVKKRAEEASTVIIDAPPGTSCPVIAAISGVDHLILVGEPTPMGLHDLALMVEVAEKLGLSFSVVVNKAGLADGGLEKFCRERKIPILLEIPYSRRIAELYSRGVPLVEGIPEWRERFREAFEKLKDGES